MKKIFFLAIVIFLMGMTRVEAQIPPVNPIPSYGYQMNNQIEYFHENQKHGKLLREKRDMDVVVTSRSTSFIPFYATVYVFKIKPNKILGPFQVLSGQLLKVPIDNSRWGVRVDCNWPADVSVWAD